MRAQKCPKIKGFPIQRKLDIGTAGAGLEKQSKKSKITPGVGLVSREDRMGRTFVRSSSESCHVAAGADLLHKRIKSFCAAKPAQKLGWPTRARRLLGAVTYTSCTRAACLA